MNDWIILLSLSSIRDLYKVTKAIQNHVEYKTKMGSMVTVT